MPTDNFYVRSDSDSDVNYIPSDDDDSNNPFDLFESSASERPSTSKRKKATNNAEGRSRQQPPAKRARPAAPSAYSDDEAEEDDSGGEDDVIDYRALPHALRDRMNKYRNELLDDIDRLSDKLPTNTLDDLIDKLGGPSKVAEMTGRKGRIVQDKFGNISYQNRTNDESVSLERLNIEEKNRFMEGSKLIAIISDAASSGISLQSDRRVANQRRRVHITLELPWSADRAVQQFGRSHRSNQVNAPEYVFLISKLAGEQRFASSVAKRLESLGALTHGDRRATESQDLSQFNLENKFGRQALEKVLKTLVGHEVPRVPLPSDYTGSFKTDACYALADVGLIKRFDNGPHEVARFDIDKDSSQITKFLNRILGVKVELQNAIFKFFTDNLRMIVYDAKKAGQWDLGIMDLGKAGESCEVVRQEVYEVSRNDQRYTLKLHQVRVQRGLSYEDAMDKFKDCDLDKDEGFYVSNHGSFMHQVAVLVKRIAGPGDKCYTYRPHIGMTKKNFTDTVRSYRKIDPSMVEKYWINQYEKSEKQCIHMYNYAKCGSLTKHGVCSIGLRIRTYDVLSGSVLSIWPSIEEVLRNMQSKWQIVRIESSDRNKVVGFNIQNVAIESLREALKTNQLIQPIRYNASGDNDDIEDYVDEF